MVFRENLMSDLGRVCLKEICYKSLWWARCRHICKKTLDVEDMVNLILLA